MRLIHLAAALAMGTFMPLQAGINARLRQSLGEPLVASLVSFCVGTAAIVLFILITRAPMPSLATAASAPWWSWIGGGLGACFVVGSVLLAYKMGATALMAWSIAGSLLASVLLDHLGLVGFTVRELTWQRLAGVALLLSGAWLVNEY
jgi:transporter family-2 protein